MNYKGGGNGFFLVKPKLDKFVRNHMFEGRPICNVRRCCIQKEALFSEKVINANDFLTGLERLV